MRGFVLIAAILLSLVLFALGIGLLGRQSWLYEDSTRMRTAAQARALARAGLEDALVKMNRDWAFPPLTNSDQRVFSYEESILDGSGQVLGRYQVTLDRSLQDPPWQILRVLSTGEAGPARYRLRGELDVAPRLRSNPAVDNPMLYRFIQVEDLGSL